MQPEVRSESEAGVRPEARGEPETVVRSESEAGVRPEARGEPKTGVRSESEAGVQPEARSESKPEARGEPKAGVQPEAKDEPAAGLGSLDVPGRVRADGLLGADGTDDADRPLVAMVSGGRDSVCLLDVAVAVRGAGSVRALHVNYGLRGEASDGDERLCARLCARLGVALEVVRVDAERRAELAAGGNLQAWARELRYGAALRLADGLGGASVATGHTASDQVETILYRLAASPGRRALLGMAARDGRIVRPLLWLTREQTADYCRVRGLEWREDESNEDERFARARVRRKLLPALRAVHPAAEASVLRTAGLLRAEGELLDELVASELGGSREIALDRLAAMHPALARLVLVRLAEDAAGDYVPQAGARLADVLELGARGGSAELHVGGNVAAVIRAGALSIRRLPPRAG